MCKLWIWIRDWWSWIIYRKESIRLLQSVVPDEFGSRVVGISGNKVRIELSNDLPPADQPMARVGGVWVCTGCLEATSNCKCPK